MANQGQSDNQRIFETLLSKPSEEKIEKPKIVFEVNSSPDNITTLNVNASDVYSNYSDQREVITNTARNLWECSDINNRRTGRCPCGANTSNDYKRNFELLHNSTNPTDLNECLNLELPLKPSDPLKCWGRIFMQPSHPTSGSSLARTLLERASGTAQIISHYNEKNAEMIYDLKDNLELSLNCNENTSADPLPMMGKPVFFKSHTGIGGLEKREQISEKFFEWSENQMANTEGGKINGVLRLARNPGDQILRNQFRWMSPKECQSRKDLSNTPDKCKLTKGHSVCRSLNVEKYLNFHSFWNNFDESTPQAIWHYEHFSSKAHALSSFRIAMNTLNETMIIKDDVEEAFAEIIHEPDYEHGTVLADICGKEVARVIHRKTKDISEMLGYVFDEEEATWSLPAPNEMNV